MGIGGQYKDLTVDELIELLEKHKKQYSGESKVLITMGNPEDGVVTGNVFIVQGSNLSLSTNTPLEGYNPPLIMLIEVTKE